jgi:hypothetical protein
VRSRVAARGGLSRSCDKAVRWPTVEPIRGVDGPDQHDGVETTAASGGIVVVITAAHLSPILSILFGILILIVPRFLNYLVAVYLILVGLLGLGVVRM